MTKIKKHKFSDLYDISSGISSTTEQAGHGSPFISFSTVFNNYFLPEVLPDKMSVSAKEQETYSVKKGDVFVTRTSETIDELAMSCVADSDFPLATFSGFTKRLRPKTSGVVYHRYLAFYLRGKYFRQTVNHHSLMTLRASFNEDIFSYLDLYLPSYKQQQEIGDYLFSLEQVIINNNAINAELEKLARTLYDYWFVQFDFPNAEGKPYKSSGGAMEYNEILKREIPKGWGVKKIKEICKIESGFPFKSDTYSDKGYKLITIKNVQDSGVNLDTDNHIETIPEKMPDFCLLKQSDILMSLTGNVGRVALMFAEKCLLNQRVGILLPASEKLRAFCYFLFQGDYMKAKMLNISGGSSQDNLSPVDTENILIPFSNDIAEKFSERVNPMIQQIVSLSVENNEIAALRDFLLPLLMNGQVTVGDAV